MEKPDFFCSPIEVETDDKTLYPRTFRWQGKTYTITEVTDSWHDWGFGSSNLRARNWRLRHHRNYFMVKTDTNEVFKIYCDRGTKKEAPRVWILLTKEA